MTGFYFVWQNSFCGLSQSVSECYVLSQEVPLTNVTYFPKKNLAYREPVYLLKISKCLRRQKRATEFLITAASINKLWLIAESEVHSQLRRMKGCIEELTFTFREHVRRCVQEIASSTSFSHPLYPQQLLFPYSHFFQSIKAILKRQEVCSGS